MRVLLFPILLLLWPLAEIAGFVLMGHLVGLWGTLGLVIGSVVLGAFLLRMQGMHLLRQLSAMGRQGQMPGRELVSGGMMVVAAILLLVPGFLTDILGLLLLIPFVRNIIWFQVGRRVVVVRPGSDGMARTRPREPVRTPGDGVAGPVIDLEEQDFSRDPSSPWTRGKPGDQ
jgi:UPF0716 protein FxsA